MFISIYIILSCLLFVCFIFIAMSIKNNKYINFLKLNSLSLNNLINLNNKYKFFINFHNFDEEYTYDNEDYYDTISCEDFFIYQLQSKKGDIEKVIKQISYNKELFNKYISEVSKIKNFGKYIQTNHKLNKKYLLKIENKLFQKNILKPITSFYIKIILKCSNLNGFVYKSKFCNFSINETLSIIQRLNNKTGSFYSDKDIWNSLCKVERGKVSNKLRFDIYKRDGYRCCICGSDENLEIDHIKPISKGGKSSYQNLQTLCKRCNKEKDNIF